MSECTHNCSTCGESCSERTAPQSLRKAPHPESHIGKVFGVVSGKGGVGKSMTSAMLAVSMRRLGFKAGVLDADITGPSIPRSFGIHEPPAVDEDGMLRPAETKTGIKVVSTNMLTADEATPFLWRGPVLNGILTQFYSDINWGELDYLIVDMPPGTGDIHLTIISEIRLDGAVIVSTPQQVAVADVRRGVNMLSLIHI